MSIDTHRLSSHSAVGREQLFGRSLGLTPAASRFVTPVTYWCKQLGTQAVAA
ncbi:hypothetical protein SSYIS1_23120 [Serratia symbiotica]|uniref:Uncharacterized protein n=1 Tax=Serratia symbiotica TaxID=138074 RepID=A0A455VTY2_9GAMM|nr:hypothetical protein SSYIS1_23120 [Serratia symbiotica]